MFCLIAVTGETVSMNYTLDESKLLYAKDRLEWRSWLEAHYRSEHEIWLVFHKKHTGKPRIAYNDAVEEALCFGWIDSTAKQIDSDRYAQRFSRRNPRSPYSQQNKERLRYLAGQGVIMPEVLAAIGDILDERFEMPADILDAIKSNKQAWKNFQAFSESYIRIRISYIDTARSRPDEFEKRLNHFIRMTEMNKMFGFGGIEKYN